MTTPGSHEHGIQTSPHAAPTGGGPHFSDSEWQALQAEDLHGAKVIVGLIASIFTIGLVLYIGVCLSVVL
jgi:hypothetical protein